MKLRKVVGAVALLLSVTNASVWAEEPTEGASTIIAGQRIPVKAGGLYDRYHSNPPLSVVEAEAPDVDLSWFKKLEKTKVDIGFESFSPNFYYKNSRITVVYTADIEQLKKLMPTKVLEKVQPVQVWPGRGLVALTAYAYDYCDNDQYNEIALSIVTNKPGNTNLGPFTLIGQSFSEDFWGYVLKLPVNTELARVRGVVGYNLPKWLTGIDRTENDKSVAYEIRDSQTGAVDVRLETKKLGDLSTDEEFVTNSFTNLGHDGELAYGYAVSRNLSYATSSDEDAVKLSLSDGNLSTYIKSLGLGKIMKYEYVPSFQSALYAPAPLKTMLDKN